MRTPRRSPAWPARALALALALLLPAAALASNVRVTHDYQYTYTYDYWANLRHSPDAYRVAKVFSAMDLGLPRRLITPASLFVRGDTLFICDTGNNRILELRREGADFALVRVIDRFTGGNGPHTFSQPQDVFQMPNGDLFIADTMNQRVLKLDRDLNLLLTMTKPSDETFDQNLAFLPERLVADSTGRAFVLVHNVNKGLTRFESDGRFTGFVGAMQVIYSIADQVWRLLSTRAQRSRQANFVPTEFDNVYIDRGGFIYSVTTTFQEYDLIWDRARPIRKLNAMGQDILVKNGEYPPIGDLDWSQVAGYNGPSRFSDITVLDNDVYVALDRTRGRLFGYDDQGRNLWVFGGAGNMDGFFRSAVSIEHMGYDLLVLDALEGTVTVFEPTEYGRLIYEATERYQRGEYAQSAESWNEVLKFNGNYELAYVGVGRALLRERRYEEAMRWFKLANDEDNYSRAFQEYRKIWVEGNIGWIAAVLGAALLVPLVISKFRSMRREVEQA
ncbi:MAG TPA: hypothetical protein VLA21_05235 [Candidatus Limnocylindria bacterium]|nr:hypothetical protein [Candidatus Limnocylindria bacterium]